MTIEQLRARIAFLTRLLAQLDEHERQIRVILPDPPTPTRH